MKTSTRSACKSIVFLCVVFLSATVVKSQTAPIYKFANPTLVSGTDKAVNAVYRFPLVTTGVDALVKINAIVGNISLRNIDRTADGYSEAFQPEYKISSLTNAYIEFQITFVHAGNSTNFSQPLVDATGLDIDGDANGINILKEFNRIDMGGGTYAYNTINSQISITQNGTAFTGSNVTGILFGALVDTAASQVMYTVSNANVTSFTYRVGANSLLTGSSNRYASLYFKKFNYPAFPLAIPKLKNFDGNYSNKAITLNWNFETTNGITQCNLERAGNAMQFETVATYLFAKEYTGTSFKYNDAVQDNGKYYYRLKMIGVNGEIKYSNVLAFSTKTVMVNEMKVYPTLVQSSVTINVSSTTKENTVLHVTDMNGRIVKQQSVNLQKGTNNIAQHGFDQLMKGNYVISMTTSQGLFSKQIVVN